MAIFPKLFIYKYLHLEKKALQMFSNLLNLHCIGFFKSQSHMLQANICMTQFCSKYWQIFQNLVSWTTFCICIKILADKRLVNNLIRGNLFSFPTYTKGQSMNWGKDSQLLLQISQTSPFAAHRVRENCLMLHMSWIFLVGMFSFPRLVESLTVTMRDLIYFDWVLIQLAALRAPIKSERTFF